MKISTEVPADLGKKVEKDFGLDSKTFDCATHHGKKCKSRFWK